MQFQLLRSFLTSCDLPSSQAMHATSPPSVLMAARMQVVLLAMPAQKGATAIDASGRKALGVLRALGLPTCLGLSCGPQIGSLQDRSAAKKAAAAALELEVPSCSMSSPGSMFLTGLYRRCILCPE